MIESLGKLNSARDNLAIWIAMRLPARVAYWAAVRVMAHATTQYAGTKTGNLSCAGALQMWKTKG